MGSWNETCILSNLPILDRSDVIALEAKNEVEFLDCLEGTPFSTRVNVAIGKMGDYGDLTDVTDIFQAVDNPKKVKFKYTDDNRFIVFCYKDVWDRIVNWCANDERIRKGWDEKTKLSEAEEQLENLASLIESIKPDDMVLPSIKRRLPPHILEKQLYFVCRFLYRARAGFPENIQRGSQQLDTQCRRLLTQWTIDQANKIEQILNEQENE
jgi:hypothetical protein